MDRYSPIEFRVLDESGRPIGTIAAPTERPVLGSNAPTVYLRTQAPIPDRSSSNLLGNPLV